MIVTISLPVPRRCSLKKGEMITPMAKCYHSNELDRHARVAPDRGERCLSCHIFYQASGHLFEHIHESLLVVTPCCCVALDVTPTSLLIVHRSSGPQPCTL